MSATDNSYRRKVEHAFAVMDADVRDEEDHLLPRLQEALTSTQLHRLGAVWEIVRRSSPTRPHPRVPRRLPGNLLLGVPLSLRDRTRDALNQASGSRATSLLVTRARASRRQGA